MASPLDISDVAASYPLSYWGEYLNFSAWFMKNVLFENKKIK